MIKKFYFFTATILEWKYILSDPIELNFVFMAAKIKNKLTNHIGIFLRNSYFCLTNHFRRSA